ncbi:MAG: hypothetical protein AAF380_02310 [Bacteroidota bacterium]
MKQYNFSHIDIWPVLVATIVVFGADMLLQRFIKKQKIPSIIIIGFRFIALFVFACGINLLSFDDQILVNAKKAVLTCLLFIAPCLGLQAIDSKKSLLEWFTQLVYYVIVFVLLATVSVGFSHLLK